MRLRRFLGARVGARFRAGGLVLGGLLVGSERCAQEGSSGRADYVIQARLDGETKELDGRLELRWINKSGESVRELLFHLYLNAYSNNRSTHLTESDGKLRGHKLEEGWSWSRVKAVRVEGALAGGPTDVFPSLRYRHPEGASEEDRTVFSVDLPEPLAPGEGVRVEIEWESQLPRVRRRTGYKDDFLLVAQWFPKLGVYEAGRGWNCHPFHRDTEFYSDYGTYDVTLDLPAEYEGKVGASGVKILEQVRNERLEVRFVAPSQRDQTLEDAFGKRPLVHDFTWTADTDTVVFRQQFRAREWAERYPEEVAKARELFGEEPKLRDVDVTVLIQPERAAQAERHYHATCAALFFYGLWFGEYPYEHITVVDPAFGAGAAGGMEYPTLFTCGTRLFTTSDMHAPEGVTVHECGHQFWYGLVGNNEFEAAWLDEGFNTYTDSEVLHRVYGLDRGTSDYARVPIDGVAVGSAPGGGALADALAARKARLPLPWLPDPKLEFLAESGPLDLWRDQPLFTFTAQWTDARRADRVGYLASPDTDPLETSAWLHADRTSYATNSYPRTGIALRTLQGLLGDGPFLRGMRHYAREFRYAHPYPADFYRSFQAGAGVDVQWYFDELFRGNGTVDWSVEVEQAKKSAPRGFFQGEGGEFLERTVGTPDEGQEKQQPWCAQILLRRTGTLALPLPVKLTFDDGSTREEVWTRAEQQARSWKRLEHEGEHKLVSVVLDPLRAYYIDRDHSNDGWFDVEDELAPWRWSERALAQYQHWLFFLQGLGG